MLFEQGLEVARAFVEFADVGWWNGEDFGPVGAGLKWGQLSFDEREDGVNFWSLGFPGEVYGEGVAFVGHAHPEFVGGDGADLGDEEVWGDLIFQFFDCEDGFISAVARDEIFSL